MINLITPLPFYDNRLEQNQYKENSSALSLYKHYSDKVKPVTWQIKVPGNIVAITGIKINGLLHSYILVPGDNPGIRIVTDGGNKWIIYDGTTLMFTDAYGAITVLDIAPGFYDWQISYTIDTAGTITTETKYSEVWFIADADAVCYTDWKLKIEAWNNDSWNGYYFNNDFKFLTYFDSFITNITGIISDDTVKDGYGRQLLSQRIISPTYTIHFDPMPNIIAVSLTIMAAMKNFVITDRLGNRYVLKNIKVSQDHIENTSMDEVSFEFTLADGDYISNFCNV